MANTKENPKEECKIVVTMSQGRETVEKKEEKTKGEVESEGEKEGVPHRGVGVGVHELLCFFEISTLIGLT